MKTASTSRTSRHGKKNRIILPTTEDGHSPLDLCLSLYLVCVVFYTTNLRPNLLRAASLFLLGFPTCHWVFETSGNQTISRDLQPSSRFSKFPPCLYGREKGREGKVLTKLISYLLKSIVECGDLSIIESNSFALNLWFQGGSTLGAHLNSTLFWGDPFECHHACFYNFITKSFSGFCGTPKMKTQIRISVNHSTVWAHAVQTSLTGTKQS